MRSSLTYIYRGNDINLQLVLDILKENLGGFVWYQSGTGTNSDGFKTNTKNEYLRASYLLEKNIYKPYFKNVKKIKNQNYETDVHQSDIREKLKLLSLFCEPN